MKFQITFKDPDGFYESIKDLPEDQREEAEQFAAEYTRYSEYLTVEFDTEAGTATVLKTVG